MPDESTPVSSTDHPAPAPAATAAERYLDSQAPLGLDGVKPFWRSTTLQGLGVLIASRVLRHYAPSVAVSGDDLVGLVQSFLEIAGALMVLIGRIKARKDIAAFLLGSGAAVLVALMLAGCQSGSPFTPASAPQPGKIPVRVVVGTTASGNSARPDQGTDYAANAQVVFGKAQPWYRRVLSLFCYGPLTAEDEARWDADLRTESGNPVPSGLNGGPVFGEAP